MSLNFTFPVLVLYVRLPPGFMNFSLSLNNNNDQIPVKPLAYKNEYYTRVRRLNGENIAEESKKEKCNQSSAANLPVSSPSKVIIKQLCLLKVIKI